MGPARDGTLHGMGPMKSEKAAFRPILECDAMGPFSARYGTVLGSFWANDFMGVHARLRGQKQRPRPLAASKPKRE
jgi:hypothetical protein